MMVLKCEGLFEGMRYIFWRAFVGSAAFELDMVLNEDAVLKDRDCRGLLKLACIIKSRRMIDNIVGLPFARLAADID